MIARFQLFLFHKLVEPTARRTSDSQHEDFPFPPTKPCCCQVCRQEGHQKGTRTNCRPPAPMTCSCRSCSSYSCFKNACFIGAVGLTGNPLVSVETISHHHRTRQTTGGTGPVLSFWRRVRNSLLGGRWRGGPVVLAGRRSPNPPSSVTGRLAKEATSEISAERKLSSISTSTR